MRTLIVLTLLAAAVTAAVVVVGSATTMSLATQQLSVKRVQVPPCDTSVNREYTVAQDPITLQWEVATVTVSQIDGSACAGATLRVTLTSTGGQVLSTEKTAVMGAGETSKTFVVSSENIPAASMGTVHSVLVGPFP